MACMQVVRLFRSYIGVGGIKGGRWGREYGTGGRAAFYFLFFIFGTKSDRYFVVNSIAG